MPPPRSSGWVSCLALAFVILWRYLMETRQLWDIELILTSDALFHPISQIDRLPKPVPVVDMARFSLQHEAERFLLVSMSGGVLATSRFNQNITQDLLEQLPGDPISTLHHVKMPSVVKRLVHVLNHLP